jgi:ElaB/YqjD/DUF883 family membrane-anchored ribosome-binding protein
MEATQFRKQMEKLMDELSVLMTTFKESLDKDEIFEVRKKIKTRINEIEQELEKLKGRNEA